MSVLQRLENGVFVVEVLVGGFITHEFKFPDLGESIRTCACSYTTS